MLEIIQQNMNPIKILVAISFLIGLCFLDRKASLQRLLLYILGCSFATEYGVFVFIYYNVPVAVLYSVSFIIHNVLWLMVLEKVYKPFGHFKKLIIVYAVLSTANLLFIEGTATLNSFTFIAGALIYLSSFIHVNYVELKKENPLFFFSNDYLLLFTPTLLFIGLSMMFGFQRYDLLNVPICPGYNLYEFICHLSDISYYLLAVIYIYRLRKTEKKWILPT